MIPFVLNLSTSASKNEISARIRYNGSCLENVHWTAIIAATKPSAVTTEPTTTGGRNFLTLLTVLVTPSTVWIRPPIRDAPHTAGRP